ncbi:calcium channel flower-like [Oppia nitens]|uniref:calcium channel flower-like n=1 Tax=Oppia nitens TaxID=1686743 RepID=UPI0023DBDA63|nr:calcium channel flower-like [Oppia nitens]
MMMNVGTPTEGQQTGSTWWVESWSSQIATALALVLVLCGLLTTISPLAVHCIFPGILQLVAAVAILSIEAPSFVAFLSFARGVGRFVEGKPYWFKAGIYAALTLVPFIVGVSFGCYGPAFILGFLASLGITALFGALVLGRKASRDEMRFQAGGVPAGQPYSPTSP